CVIDCTRWHSAPETDVRPPALLECSGPKTGSSNPRAVPGQRKQSTRTGNLDLPVWLSVDLGEVPSGRRKLRRKNIEAQGSAALPPTVSQRQDRSRRSAGSLS